MSKERGARGRFNIIDAFIILLVAACVFSVVYRALGYGEDGNTDSEKYAVRFVIDDISAETAKYLINGDTVRLKEPDTVLGTLGEVTVTGGALGAYDENGDGIYYPAPEDDERTHVSVSGIIFVEGKARELAWKLTYLSAGTQTEIVTEHAATNIRVLEITPET